MSEYMTYIAKANKDLKNNDFTSSKLGLEAAIRERNDFYLYHQKLGELYLHEGDIKKALGCFERVLHLNPELSWLKIRVAKLKKESFQSIENKIENAKKSNATKRFCGIYDVYPDLTGKRQAEGGLRIKGENKASRPNQPLVTIITVVFNNDQTLQRCIDSVLAQTYPNIEYIVIDGGSSAETLQIIHKNANFIDYFISEHDAGIYSAMNKGIKLARGDYICLLNSDDIFESQHVQQTVASINGTDDVYIVYTNFYEGEKLLRAQPVNDGVLFGNLNLCHCSFLVASRCYDEIGGYNEDLKIVSDVVWIRNAYLRNKKFIHLDQAYFRFSTGGMSSGNTPERRQKIVTEIATSYQYNFPFLSTMEAEKIYFLRFNDKHLDSILDLSKNFPNEKLFISAVSCYVAFCFREREPFKLPHTESNGKFSKYIEAADLLGFDKKNIRINTSQGCFSDLLNKIDSVISLRKNNQKKTIIHFVSIFSSPSETFIYNFITKLENDTKYDNYVICDQVALQNERAYNKAICIPWSHFRPEVATQIYRYVIDKLKVDLVIGHFALNEWKWAMRVKSFNPSIPTISMTHGIDAFALRDKVDYKKYILEEFCERPNTAFTAVSQYLKDELLSHGIPEDKITLIHNAVDSAFFQHRKDNNFYDGLRTLKLLSVGRLIKLKGHNHLIRAIKIFKDNCCKDIHLTIVYGNDRDILESLEALIRVLDLSQNITLVPFINFKLQPDYFSKFDCFIHPSTYSDDQYQRSETFGVAVLEAIAAGLPVISTDAGGLPEVIGENCTFAQIVPHADSEAIAHALERFWKSREAFSDNSTYAKDRLSQFSSEKQLAIFSKLINKVTNTAVHVALFSSSTMQGAGYAAYRLHRGLKSLPDYSVVSDIFTTVRNHESQPGVHVLKHSSGNGKHWRFLQPPPKAEHTIFTINQPSIASKDLIAWVDKYDVINLHWHARFLSVENIATLTNLGKPVVMTIRDMFPITGGCHSFHGCEQWKKNCADCPQIPSSHKNYPAKVLAAKRKYYNFSNLTLVTLSRHTLAIVSQAPHFKDCRIETIPNSIETDVFRPYKKSDARKQLGLPMDRPIIGYVPSFSSSVKGYKEIINAFDILKKNWPSGNPFVLLVGNETPATSQISFDKIGAGYISDNHKLAVAYSAADVVVVPSLEETFSNTAAEAISCGVPVVGFKTGAIPELALDGKTGYTYEIGDAHGLADGIQRILTGPNLSKNCRAHALSYYSFMQQAERYELLFHELASYGSSNHRENVNIFECFDELGRDALNIALEMYGN